MFSGRWLPTYMMEMYLLCVKAFTQYLVQALEKTPFKPVFNLLSKYFSTLSQN